MANGRDSDGGQGHARGVTIIDVARAAGVSPMTVSRVINHVAGVRPEKRAAVQAAVRRLGYVPNLMARALVTARELRIAVLYANGGAAFMRDLLASVFEEAATRQAQLLLVKGAPGQPPGAAAIARLAAARIGGVLLLPPLGESATLGALLAKAGLPVVAVGGGAGHALSVGIDDAAAAYAMACRLIALGHRRLGFVPGNPDQAATAARLAGVRRAVVEGDATLVVAPGDFSFASGLAAGEALLARERPPSAIFAANDDMAAAIVSVAHRRGLDVPRDLSVAGFDDSTAAVTLWPPLTTVRQPVAALAAGALDLLVAAMTPGRGSAGERRILPHELVERDSTAPLGA